MPTVLNSAGDAFHNGDYTVLNNDWDTPQNLLNQPGSSSAISIASAADAPNSVTMSWTFPDSHPPAWIWAYPEVHWGGQFGGTVPALTTTLDNLDTLDVTFSLKDTSPDSDILIEVWTTDDSGKQTDEIGVVVYGGGNGASLTYSDAFITATENDDANGFTKGQSSWRYVNISTTHDMLSGTISFSNIIKSLISRGLANPNDHISGLELGAEMWKGTGSLEVDHFSVYEALKTTHTITDSGTAAGQVFDITTNNAYVIDGGVLGSGTDTVRIDAPLSAVRVGVEADGHLSLSNASYGPIDIAHVGQIQFSDQILPVSGLPQPTSGNDVLATTASVHEIHGGAGDDTITATSGDSYLRGEDGNDSIVGSAGFDDINGNKGDDKIDGGSGGNDWLVGGQGDDLITAHASDNILYGNLGADTLNGGSGDEILRGGQGDDSISGGAGNDWISGDRGNDTLSGGAGADTFHTFSGAGVDKVTDFNAAEGDRVQVDAGTHYTVSQVGADTVIDMGNGDQMILVGVDMNSLPSGWIFAL